jgi:hypothetical protein
VSAPVRPYVWLSVENEQLRTWTRPKQNKRVPGGSPRHLGRTPEESAAGASELVAEVIARSIE